MASSVPSISLSNFTGLDFNQLLQASLAASQVPISRLQDQLVADNFAISTLGKISGDFSSVQTSLNAINLSLTIPPVAATTSSNAPFTAAVTGAPLAGTYTAAVSQLATAQTLASQGYLTNTATIGTGTITVTMAGASHVLTIDSTNNTLAGVAGAFAAAGVGVTVQVLNTGLPGVPFRLQVTSNQTGAGQAFSITSSLSGGVAPDFVNTNIGPTVNTSVAGTATPTVGGSYTGTLSQSYTFTVTSGGTVGTDPLMISYQSDSGTSGTLTIPSTYVAGGTIAVADGLNLSLGSGTLVSGDKFAVATFAPQINTARDAKVQIGNTIVTSATNQVSNAIPGLTLNLNNVGGAATITVAPDQGAQSDQVNSFVGAYNTLVRDIASNTQAQPNKTAPPLAGDGGLRSSLFNLQSQLGTVNLSKLGITVDKITGQLSFSQSVFAAAQTADPVGANQGLSALQAAFSPTVDAALAPNTGPIAAETTSDQTQADSLLRQIATLDSQLQQQKTQLQAEYAKIQAAVASYQSLSQFFQISGGNSSSTSALPGSNLTLSA